MKIIKEAHIYELEGFKKDQGYRGSIEFVEMDESGNYKDGTTNEEVLEVLIDRTNLLNKKFPCRENALAITKMQEALMWFHERTRERNTRGVEGTHKV